MYNSLIHICMQLYNLRSILQQGHDGTVAGSEFVRLVALAEEAA